MEEEMEKLADLEFEYNIARLSRQKEEIIKNAKEEYEKQSKRVLELQKNEEIYNKAQEK